MKNNVYIILHTLSTGGAERHASSIANYLSENDYHVTIVLMDDNIVVYDLAENIKICALPEQKYPDAIMSEQATAAAVGILFDELNAFLRIDGFCRVVYKAVPWIYHRLPSEEDLFALFLHCGAQILGRDISSTIIPTRPVKWKHGRLYAAHKARSNGIIVTPSDNYAAFWLILSDNLMRKFGARPVHTLDEMMLLHSRFPDHIRLWTAHSAAGELLAGTVLYVNDGVVHSQYISASDEGKRLHAVDGLYDHIIHRAYACAAYIDLGTSNMPNSSDLHESLIFQKEGFGGRAVCYDTYEWTL
jgi:hypothetical protein